jgi:hypothetical protein
MSHLHLELLQFASSIVQKIIYWFEVYETEVANFNIPFSWRK